MNLPMSCFHQPNPPQLNPPQPRPPQPRPPQPNPPQPHGGGNGGVDVETVESDEESTESNPRPRPMSRCQATMDALSDKCAACEPSVDKKIQEIARRINFTTISEDDFIRELLHLTTNTRTDCSCKVVMGLTYVFCDEKKKLISPESVRTIRRATRTLRKF